MPQREREQRQRGSGPVFNLALTSSPPRRMQRPPPPPPPSVCFPVSSISLGRSSPLTRRCRRLALKIGLPAPFAAPDHPFSRTPWTNTAGREGSPALASEAREGRTRHRGTNLAGDPAASPSCLFFFLRARPEHGSPGRPAVSAASPPPTRCRHRRPLGVEASARPLVVLVRAHDRYTRGLSVRPCCERADHAD